jgi:general secretion pathway protein G
MRIMTLSPRAMRGFSLIEMLLVLGLIAFVATMLFTNVIKNQDSANRKAAQAGVRKVATAVDQFYLDNGSVPTKIEDLVNRPASASNWNGPYLRESQILDPWKNTYVLKVPGEGGEPYEVISYGSDKAPGGKDAAADVSSAD